MMFHHMPIIHEYKLRQFLLVKVQFAQRAVFQRLQISIAIYIRIGNSRRNCSQKEYKQTCREKYTSMATIPFNVNTGQNKKNSKQNYGQSTRSYFTSKHIDIWEKGKKKKHRTGDAYNTPYLQPPVLLVVLKKHASQHFILSSSSSNLLV